MKNVTTLLFLTIFFLGQTVVSSAQVRLGAKAGLNLANINADDELEFETKTLTTWMVGAVVEFDFSEQLGIGTGLQYQNRGAKYEGLDDAQVTFAYLQVPVQLQYRNNGLFAGVGPYFAFPISGKSEFLGFSEDTDFGSGEDDDWSPLDYGVNLELGYEFGSLRATASYGLGLANGVPKDQREALNDASAEHAVIGIAITYLFGQE